MKADSNVKEQVLAALNNGSQTNKSLRELLGVSTKAYNATLDETLQKLRKEGLITYENRAWRSTNMEVCPECAGHGLVPKKTGPKK